MRPAIVCSWVMLLSVLAGLAQTDSSSTASDGLQLLQQVAQQYAGATSYQIDAVEERTSSSEFQRSWQKSVITAAEDTSHRQFYYGGRSLSGSALKVGDGKTVWTYRVDEHRYTAKPQTEQTSSPPRMVSQADFAIMDAQHVRRSLGQLAKSFKSAERLPDSTLFINGALVACSVVRVRSSDAKREHPDNTFEKTIWIDKTHNTVIKIVDDEHTYLASGSAHIPLEEEIVTYYTTTLNSPPRADLFRFTPPADARHIEDFPDPMQEAGGPNRTGELMPALTLKSADGKAVPLYSFRGKPVLIDYWATWCSPCVESLPQLARIHEETKNNGLVLLAIDMDEEAGTAAEFLKKKGYAWPDFHDDGEVEKAIGNSGIPRVLMVNAEGTVVYDGAGGNDDALRAAIAKLGPEYAALAQQREQTPCLNLK